MAAQSQRPPLQQLLSQACSAPNCIHTQDGGAVLALSIHCLFVQAGFTSLQALRPNDYTPQPDWNCSRDAWTFQYKRKGCANMFTYECGLQASTGQAYVHVTEDRNDNTSFMGLILQKYIPEVARLNQDNWAGVVANESDLTTYFDNYIMNPVLSKAMPAFSSHQNGGSNSRIKITVAAGVASLLCMIVWSIKRNQQS